MRTWLPRAQGDWRWFPASKGLARGAVPGTAEAELGDSEVGFLGRWSSWALGLVGGAPGKSPPLTNPQGAFCFGKDGESVALHPETFAGVPDLESQLFSSLCDLR